MTYKFILSTFCAFLLAAGIVVPSMAASLNVKPVVTEFGPIGMQRDVRQIRMQFSHEMVALGNSDAPAAANVVCEGIKERPRGRWVDGMRWVAEFSKALPDGVLCKVTPHSLKTLTGVALETGKAWQFDTGGPRVLQSLPNGEASESAITAFKTSALVARKSLQHLTCQVNRQALSVRILDGQERLAAWRALQADRHQRSNKEELAAPEENWILAACGAKNWPNSAKVNWRWGRAIASETGLPSLQDQDIHLTVREKFTVYGDCTHLGVDKWCDPRQAIQLHFSAPIALQDAKKIVLKGSNGKIYQGEGHDDGGHITQWRFAGPFTPGERLQFVAPTPLYDLDQRALAANSLLSQGLHIANLPPYLGMLQSGGVLPGNNNTWPIVVRHVESQLPLRRFHFTPANLSSKELIALHKRAAQGPKQWLKMDESSLTQAFALSQALLQPFGVGKKQEDVLKLAAQVGQSQLTTLHAPLKGFGTWVLEADSPALRTHLRQQIAQTEARKSSKSDAIMLTVAKSPAQEKNSRNLLASYSQNRLALLQQTNLRLSAQMSKKGDSLVWLSSYETGLALPGVDVEVWSCDTKLLLQTKSDQMGRVMLPAATVPKQCLDDSGADASEMGIWLIARQGADRVVLHARNDVFDYESNWVAHTILDRSLLQPGETVAMQHVLRQKSKQGWTNPGAAKHFKVQLQISHHGTLLQEKTLDWHADGTADTSWVIPRQAKLGQYEYVLKGQDEQMLHSGSFQVEEFKTPAFDAQLRAQAKWQADQSVLKLQGGLSFLSGGAAAGQALTLNGKFRFEYTPPLQGYQFTAPLEQIPAALPLPEQAMVLDQHGRFQRELNTPKPGVPLSLLVEMRFADPNGETQTHATEMTLWPTRYKTGVKIERSAQKKELILHSIVLDEQDQPLANHNLVLERVAKVANESANAIQQDATPLCSLKTDAKGRAQCEIAWPWQTNDPEASWHLQLRAEHAMTWQLPMRQVDYAWLGNAAAMELVDGAPRAGSQARLLVRAPFLPASLLLSVEREGVFTSHLYQLTQSSQEISLPILDYFAPAVRLHGQFVRGSAQGGVQSHLEDLPVLLDPASHRLDLAIQPAVKEARPGQVLPVHIKASHALSGKPAAGANLTLAVVDEALLALKENPTWALFDTFWQHRAIDVAAQNLLLPDLQFSDEYLPPLEQSMWRNCTWKMVCPPVFDEYLQRRMAMSAPPAPAMAESAADMSAKGAAATGGDALRQNFSTLAAWRTQVVLDQQGAAEIKITLPDSLTKWRIVAIAMQGADHFGLGEAGLVVNKPLQILSGLPQTVRSGDALQQTVTLRNTSARPMRLKFDAMAKLSAGLLQAGTAGMQFSQELELAAGENKLLAWNVTVPEQSDKQLPQAAQAQPPELIWQLVVREQTGNDTAQSDQLQVRQSVVPLHPLTVREASLLQVQGEKSIAVAPLANAKADGEIRVNWQASLVQGPILSARAWMRDYPYTCLEQRASKAAVSGESQQWQAVLESLAKHMDNNGLLSYFPEASNGSEVLTAYLLDLAKEYQLPLPPAQAEQMKRALQVALVRGQSSDWLPNQDVLSHKLALQAALAPDLGKAKPVIPQDLNSLPTIALIDWVRYLLSLPDHADRQEKLKLAASHLRNRYDLHGTRLVWRGDARDNGWWFMWSPELALARTLSLVQRWQLQDPSWQADLPRLAAALADKQSQGSWRTTTGNAWAVAALTQFQASSEAGTVSGVSQARLDEQTASYTWPSKPASTATAAQSAASVALAWPKAATPSRVFLKHEGAGAPWATVQILGRVPGQELARGLSVKKIITPVQQKVAGKWSVGDVLKVRLEMESAFDVGWVVVHDPIPSGASILGKGLGRESKLAQESVQTDRWWWQPSAVERGSDSYRGYYQRVWRGNWQTEYALRLNNAGSFQFPATRIEAMYAPEIFGESPNSGLQVQVGE